MNIDLESLRSSEASEGRNGIVTVVGCANVGKSTLLNHMVDEKVTIVSHVPQTTRNVIRAIWTEERGQLVFLDTPGVHKAANNLGKTMNKMARRAVEGADVVCLVLDRSRRPFDEDEGWMRKLCNLDTNFVLILNKADLTEDHTAEYKALWERVCEEKEGNGVKRDVDCFGICAQTGWGIEALMDRLFELMPVCPPLFPEDILTDYPRKLAMSDFIREKLFYELHQELPHEVDVHVTDITEHENEWCVSANIYVNRPSQKGIVIGHRGRLIRKVKRSAVKELSDAYGVGIRLELSVKVEPKWMENYWLLREMGYVDI